jgi:hypothetical protein
VELRETTWISGRTLSSNISSVRKPDTLRVLDGVTGPCRYYRNAPGTRLVRSAILDPADRSGAECEQAPAAGSLPGLPQLLLSWQRRNSAAFMPIRGR